MISFVMFGCIAQQNTQVAVDKASTASSPNIVIFLADDQGWGDVGFNGNDILDTPNIDEVAKQGVSFDRFYVNPVCSPTRAALLTGRHSLRTGVFSVTRGGEKMKSSEITLAESLKSNGYVTGLFGKWHNGSQYPHDPNGQGFDQAIGIVDGHQTLYFDASLLNNGTYFQSEGYIADVIGDSAVNFITNNKNQPFFAYIPFNTPHGPFEVPDKYFDKYKKQGLSALDSSIYGMMENLDENVGKVLKTLDSLNLSDNTIVIFMSDNGPAFPHNNTRYNGGMKGSKGSVDEGGVRAPFFIHWPGHIEGGRVIKSIAQHIDVFPTLLSMIGIDLPQDRKIDGRNLTSLLYATTDENAWPERNLYTHHFRNTNRPDQLAIAPSPGAIRNQDWLATFDKNGSWHLYNIPDDPSQNNDLAEAETNRLQAMKDDYMTWFKDVSEGSGKPIAIEIGHKQRNLVELPANEASIFRQGIDYAHGSGWSHDWLVVKQQPANGQITWPVKIVRGGKYKLVLRYAAPESNVSSKMTIQLADKSLDITPSFPQYQPTVNKGQRRYYTDEAAELSWSELEINQLYLNESDFNLSLSFNIQGGELWIKALNIVAVD